MRVYLGVVSDRDWQVSIEDWSDPDNENDFDTGEPLPPRNDLSNHSPDGFAWGYGGSGPAQLALALVAHITGDDQEALRLHQTFKSLFIAGIGQDEDWVLSAGMLKQMVAVCRLWQDKMQAVHNV